MRKRVKLTFKDILNPLQHVYKIPETDSLGQKLSEKDRSIIKEKIREFDYNIIFVE